MTGNPVVKTSFPRLLLSVVAWVTLVPLRGFEPAVVSNLSAPWRIHQTTKAHFPPRLLQNAVTHGEARVRASIDASGRLLDALVISCTHRDFGAEALRVVQQWRFDPGLENGAPIGVVGDITFAFVMNGVVAVANNSPLKSDEPVSPDDSTAYGAASLKNLDRIPTPTHVVPPVYPRNWADRGIVGSATVEFFIDESGRARIPLVAAADHPLLGASAVAAIAQWQFEPPTCHGRRVLVRAEQVFAFQPEKN